MPALGLHRFRTLFRPRAMQIARGALLLMLAGTAHAGPLFEAPFLAFPLNGPVSFIASADLDSDGNRDLVCSSQSGTVRVALGLGDGTFAAPAAYSVSAGGSPPVLADLTGDGKLDIAIADFPNTSVGILPGNGDGTFGDTIKVATGFQCYTMVVALMNGDNIPDLVVANWTDVGVLIGNGDGTFGAMTSFPTPTNAYHLAAGDLNYDGHPDVVSSSDYSQVTVLRGTGTGALASDQGFAVGNSINEVEVVDATGDGLRDVVAAVGGGVTIFPGKGDGTFQPRIELSPLTSHGTCEVGDVNGDTRPDIVSIAASFSGPTNLVAVLLGDGLGGFPIQRLVETVYSPADVELADIDGDSDLDLLVASSSGLVAVHLNNGDGTFGTIRRYATGADPVAVGLGDLDGDAKADLVVAHRGSASISVRAGSGNGRFGIRRDYDTNLIKPITLALGDLDGDSHADVAVADVPGAPGTAGVRVFNGYADGSFAATGSYATGFLPSGIAIGDLDEDGDRDLVVTDETANRASVLRNTGTGTFLAAVHYGAGVGASGVAIGDVNGDLHLDVVTANRQAGSVTVLFGDGDGSFTGEVELMTAPDCRAIAIGLVNADGIPDLVTANGTSSTVSVLLGQGGGAFAPATTIETGLIPTSIAIAGFDDDALPDLVVGAGTTPPGPFPSVQVNVIAVMRGSGGGAFQPPLMLGSADQPEAVAVADLDGSGTPDIVAANRVSETVTVLLNTSSVVAVASLTAPVELALGHGYPNPSPASVTLRYAIPSPSEAALRVYDAGGRLVRVLAEGVMPAGEHFAVWDRRTDHGTRAAAGVYFCDLRVSGRHVTRRIVLL